MISATKPQTKPLVDPNLSANQALKAYGIKKLEERKILSPTRKNNTSPKKFMSGLNQTSHKELKTR